MNFLLNITENDYGTEKLLQSFSFSEVLSFGGQMLLIGMATVFSVLCIIWLCLVLFKLVFHDLPNRKNATKYQAEIDDAVETASVADTTDHSEIIAVIAAAIAMAESESSDTKFRVVSFRRI